MQHLIAEWKLMLVVIVVMVLGRYIFLAGTAFLLCYKPGIRKLQRYKIHRGPTREKQVRNELVYSLSTICIFSGVGLGIYFLYINGRTTIYLDVNEYGWVYFICSLAVMIVLHDIYFYFIHRLLHIPWLLRHVHVVHHRSVNPTPLAAYSFHPFEAMLQSLIVFPFVTLLPVNLFAFLLFTFVVLFFNVLGHLGFELMPKRFRCSKAGKLFTSTTHHHLHHQKGNRNYSFYFTWCDRFFHTMHKDTFK